MEDPTKEASTARVKALAASGWLDRVPERLMTAILYVALALGAVTLFEAIRMA